MIIEIKNKQYVNPDWRVSRGIGELQIHTEATFTELAADFDTKTFAVRVSAESDALAKQI